jgi:glycosyltransferase involved in cell wall biosynthesis
MNFSEFKKKYIKVPVVEHPNNREGKVPLVTVKVVTYNHVNYIKQCLDSILMQKTDFDYEILIAEDDSNEGTREICIEYADKYPNRIRLFLNSRENNIPINGRVSGVFNSVYSNFLIESKYIAIIEGDDYWTDNTSLQKRVSFLEQNNDFVLCYHSFVKYDQVNKRIVNSSQFENEPNPVTSEKFFKAKMQTLTILYKNLLRDNLFDLDMLQTASGDAILKGKLSIYGKAKFIDTIKPAVYRIHSSGFYSLQLPSKQAKDSIEARKYLINYFKKRNIENKYIVKNLIFYYYTFFRKILREERKIKIEYAFNIFFYSLRYNISIAQIFIRKTKQKLNKKYGSRLQ